MKRLGQVLGSLLAVALAVLSLQAAAETRLGGRDFNHMTTGFPLSGGHAAAACETCHIGGVFRGTPRNCDGCHTVGKRIVATPKSNEHIVTDAPCESCHFNTATWLGARFNHGTAKAGQCATCHNGRIVAGKPASHSAGNKATKSCDSCHRTVAWLPVSWNHNNAAGLCSTCHVSSPDVSSQNRKPAGHMAPALKGTLECDSCHFYTAWYPNGFKHNTGGACSSCHNATLATGKTASHTLASVKGQNECSDCHYSTAWRPASFKHNTAAACSSCHNGTKAVGKSAGHVATADECNQCHFSTTTWTGALGGKPANHIPYNSGVSCSACHIGTSVVAQGATLHGYVSSTCTTCHLKGGASYLGGMDKKSIGHEGMKSGDDCSQSGCHKPLGKRGSSYVNWD